MIDHSDNYLLCCHKMFKQQDYCILHWLKLAKYIHRILQSIHSYFFYIVFLSSFFFFQISFMQVCSSNFVGNLLGITVWSICSRLAVWCISLYLFFASNWWWLYLHGESRLSTPLSSLCYLFCASIFVLDLTRCIILIKLWWKKIVTVCWS